MNRVKIVVLVLAAWCGSLVAEAAPVRTRERVRSVHTVRTGHLPRSVARPWLAPRLIHVVPTRLRTCTLGTCR